MKRYRTLLLFFLLFSCRDAGTEMWIGAWPVMLIPNTSQAEAERLIIGKWVWVEWPEGLPEPIPVTYPPFSRPAERLDIRANGTAYVRRADTLYAITTWVIQWEPRDSRMLLGTRGFFSFRVNGEYFGYNNTPVDGDMRLYRRETP